MVPAVGLVTFVIISTSVVFPAPFLPSKPKILDLGILKVRSFTAVKLPNFFEILLIFIATYSGLNGF